MALPRAGFSTKNLYSHSSERGAATASHEGIAEAGDNASNGVRGIRKFEEPWKGRRKEGLEKSPSGGRRTAPCKCTCKLARGNT